MKYLSTFLVFCLMAIGGLQAQNCDAMFTYVDQGNGSFSFFDSSFVTPGFQANYLWSFGDGTIDTLPFTSHTYNAPGTYNVCLTISTTNGACVDSICQPIVVLSGGGGGMCNADFNISSVQGGTVQFANLSSPSNAAFFWSFGDGSGSSANNPTHTYASNGTYTVCLVVDASTPLGGPCLDTTCLTLTITGAGGGNPNCMASFTASFDTTFAGPGYTFDGSSSTGSSNLTYLWDLGNGTVGTGQTFFYPVNSPSPTPLYVCLTISDSAAGCFDTFCDTVSISGGGGGSNCQASFNVLNLQGPTYQFTNTSSPSNGNFFWDFGDGNSSTATNPVHSYSANGTYTVCLIVTDFSNPANSCADTLCSSITVTGAGGGNPSCMASFVVYPDSTPAGTGFIFDGSSSTGSPNLVYAWDFGDGNTGNGPVASHQYNSMGPFVICLTISDMLAGCSDTVCDTLYISGGPGNCNADFSYAAFGDTVSFVNLSSGQMATYLWDFGDGNSSTATNPTHIYSNAGTYVVCLTTTVAMGGSVCTDIYCDSVVIGANPPSGLSISGSVFASSPNTVINNGVAYLIYHDSTAGTLSLIDTVSIVQNSYTFYGLNGGSYLVKAALTPNSPHYATHLPTYLGDDLFWYNATSVVLTAFNITNPPINLVQGNNPGGPGFIGGLISQGANKQGDPLNGISVLLLDNSDNPIAHTESDIDGNYEFPSLAYGTYKVYLEVAGTFGDPIIITLSPMNPTVEFIDFNLDEDSWASASTSIEELSFGEVLSLYPNPAKDLLTVELELKEMREIEFSVRNIVGAAVYQTSASRGVGAHRFEIPVSTLAAGTYLLQIRSEDQQSFHRFVKAE